MANKNMYLAMILSLIVPGLGLAYDGVIKKFLGYLVLGLIFIGFWAYFGMPLDAEVSNTGFCCYLAYIITWIFGLYDTLRTTIDINRGNNLA
jgi:hypothetical protein